ncbi:PepSY domain-containing protein [Serinicoccus sp. LYQ131]|uniref:PepSY domain-containing protein n=1 Tax=Serinicoccus sp. LYQ131 TaxID=3378797 RepID=UPI0038521A69
MTRTRPHLTAALSLTLALGLSACGGDESSLDGVNADAPVDMTTDDAAAGATDGATATDGTADDAGSAGDQAASTDTAAPAADDVTAAALAAISTAEDAVGGTAYEIDDQDGDGTWEVEVAVGDRSHEVTVSADGAQVVGTPEEDGLDADDAAALEAAQATLVGAIETAVDEVGGVLDGASLDEEDGSHRFEVELDRTGGDDDDITVVVDAATGEVVASDA